MPIFQITYCETYEVKADSREEAARIWKDGSRSDLDLVHDQWKLEQTED